MRTQTDIDQTTHINHWKKRMLAIALLGAAMITGLAWYQSAAAQGNGPFNANCFEGTWVLRLPDGRFAKETIVPGRNGQDFHFNGHTVMPDPDPTLGGLFPDAQNIGDGFFGSAHRTGFNMYEFRAIFHNVNVVDGTPMDVAYIGIIEGVVVLPDCDTQLITMTQSIYLPEQDADGDGIPDEGEEPLISVPDIPVTGKKL